MNWNAIGAIGELVGAFAVVATLLYLAAQIRQNNASQRVAAKQEMTRQFADFVDFLVLNPDLESLHDRGLAGDELSPGEILTFNRIMAKATWYLAVMHFQFRIQKLDGGDWEESRSLINFLLQYTWIPKILEDPGACSRSGISSVHRQRN